MIQGVHEHDWRATERNIQNLYREFAELRRFTSTDISVLRVKIADLERRLSNLEENGSIILPEE